MKTTIVFVLLVISCFGFTQSKPDVLIQGEVVDSKSDQPLEFCSLLLMKLPDSTVIAGTTTDVEGRFELEFPDGGNTLVLKFIGYQDKIIREFPEVSNGVINLGRVTLDLDEDVIDGLNIRAEKSETVFKLDKRVFNVGKDLSNSGASAIEVLNNVPSVDVTLEGLIRLRGNSGVQILINGKPSVMASNSTNALGSITADMIDRVEVITNPSAKYDAAGTVGIINIVLRNETKKGLNGSLTLNTGYPNNHSLGLSANYRSERFNLFSQIGLGTRRFVSIDSTINRNKTGAGSEFITNGESEKNENFANIRLGSDFYINSYNTLTLSGHFAYELENQYADLRYLQTGQNQNVLSRFNRTETTTAINPKYQYDLNYQKKFKSSKERLLNFSAEGSYFGKDKNSEFDNTLIEGANLGNDQETSIFFANVNHTFQLDYTHPIKEKWTAEAGSKYEINRNSNDSKITNIVNGVETVDTQFTNVFNYEQDVLAFYTTLAYEGEKFGVMTGVRYEQTFSASYVKDDRLGEWNYGNFFPSAHMSYKLTKTLSSQLGYSRRIDRPFLFELSPYFSFRDNYNLSVGNPELQPEFSNVFELTTIKTWDKVSGSFTAYYSVTTDVVEEVITVIDTLTIESPANVGSSSNTGIEVNTKIDISPKISMSVDGNLVYFNRTGSYNDQNFDFSNYRWNLRSNWKFKLPKDFEVQLTANYQSKEQGVFQDELDYFFMNAGIRKKIAKGKFIVNLSSRDIFNSRIHRSITDRPEYYVYSRGQRGRYTVLGLSYNFGKGEAMEFSGHKMF